MHKAKFRRPPVPGLLIALGEHAYGNSVFVFNNGLELPHSGARESMRGSVGVVCLGAEPGKADRDSPSDRLTFLPARFRAHKKRSEERRVGEEGRARSQ